MSISADQLVICKGISLLQFFMAEAPGRFLFGIEKGQMLLEFSVHGWVVKGHTGVRLPFQRFVAHIIDVLTDRPQHVAVALRLPTGKSYDRRLLQRLFQGLAPQIPDNGLELVPQQFGNGLRKTKERPSVKESRAYRNTVFLQLREEFHPHLAAHGLAIYQGYRGYSMFA